MIGHGEEGIGLAKALNEKLAAKRAQLQIDDAMTPPEQLPANGRNPLITEAVESFRLDELTNNTERNYSQGTIRNAGYKLDDWKHYFSGVRVRELEFDTFRLARYLKTKTHEAARQHRSLFNQFFSYCIEEGFIRHNPAASLRKRKQQKRRRLRHTWEGYLAIVNHDDTPEWLKRTMKQAVLTLQRRGDLCALQRDAIDMKQRTLTVRQQKTGTLLSVGMGDELLVAIRESIGSEIPCPYIVHRRPINITHKAREAKVHPFAVTPDYLSKAFRKARDASGAYDHIEHVRMRPTFHDLRALGVFAYFQAGYSVEYIQALAGHADKSMTEAYREGHEREKAVAVQAGIALASIDWSAVDWETPLPDGLREITEAPEE